MPPWTRLADAAALVFTLHGVQYRKGTSIPYIAHLMSVSALVLEHGGDEDQAIAGLLHDAIEDAGTIPKPPWRARKEACLAHLAHVPAKVLLVSARDKPHNARAIVSDPRTHGPEMFTRFNAGQEGTLWYYDALATVFCRRLPSALADERRETVDEMRRRAKGTG